MPGKSNSRGKEKFNLPVDPLGSDTYSSHLFDLSNSINNTITDILNLLTQVYRRKQVLELYAKDLSNGSTNASLNVYFEKYKDLSSPELDDVIDSFRFLNERNDFLTFINNGSNGNNIGNKDNNSNNNNSNESIENNSVSVINNQFEEDSKKLISRQRQLRANHNYRDVLSFIPGTDIPDIDLNHQAKTVRDIWNEWNFGYKGKPPLCEIERQYGTKWRRGRIAKSAQRRKKLIEFIQNEFRNHSDKIMNILDVVDELDKYRLTRGKGLFWLYGNTPKMLYNENGIPLNNDDGQMLIRHEFPNGVESTDNMELVNNGNGTNLPKKETILDKISHEELVNSATAAVLAQDGSHSLQNDDDDDSEEGDNEEESDEEESVEEVQRTQQLQDSTQSTEGDLRRLENIQRLIDQHESVGMSELSEHTDPALEKL